MRRNAALLLGAAAGAVAALLLRRRRASADETPLPDPRAEELRRRLAEASATAVDEEDFEAAGMGAETVAAEETRPPADEFEAMRRRVHAEGRAAAEAMRRRAEGEA